MRWVLQEQLVYLSEFCTFTRQKNRPPVFNFAYIQIAVFRTIMGLNKKREVEVESEKNKHVVSVLYSVIIPSFYIACITWICPGEPGDGLQYCGA